MEALDRGDLGAYERNLPPLLPERHPDLDFFVCDILDAAPKDDLGSMEHPMFSLSTKPDHRIRHYEHNGNSLTIAPGAHGLATIWDKDVLIYCISQVVEAMNRGHKDVPRKVWVTAYDLLVATNRQTSGEGYKKLKSALDRLASTYVKTNIETGDERVMQGFTLIDSWEIVEKNPGDQRMVAVEITLSEWIHNAITGRDVLTISKEYFRLRKGMERRLYEIARKHCGKQTNWKISLALLHKKSGSSGTLREFRRKLKGIAKSDHMPDYRIVYDEDNNQVTFYIRSAKGHLRAVKDVLDKPKQGELL
ncbi:MAG: replication initiator protein A [Gammaproteobacteria bacterium]|nr:replication initiator protein A [Gammaproteobacteria bacterium]